MTSAGGPLVLWLDEVGKEPGSLVGGKFSSLAEMAASGFGVPPAFAVTTAAYRAFMRESGLDEQARALLGGLDRDDLEAVEAAGEAMRHAIEGAPFSTAIATAVTAAYARLCEDVGCVDVPVAVRSSGVAEDSAGASFAGQYDTYLWVIGEDEVRSRVRRCWTGLFGAAVLTYRPEGGEVAAGDPGMAVVVQQMVEPRAAGVMFTLDPVTGDRSKVVIEAAWGLGEAVVAGEVTPDRFRIDKVTLEVIGRTIVDKPEEYRFEPGSGTRLRPVPDERRRTSSLEDTTLGQLATLAKQIERHRGAPQDIEWAVDDAGRIHVLQVRPETVWSRREARTVAGGSVSAVDLVLGAFVSGGRLPPKEDAPESDR